MRKFQKSVISLGNDLPLLTLSKNKWIARASHPPHPPKNLRSVNDFFFFAISIIILAPPKTTSRERQKKSRNGRTDWTTQNLLGVVKNFREENLESSGASESQSSAEPFVKLGVPGDVWRWGEMWGWAPFYVHELCIYLKTYIYIHNLHNYMNLWRLWSYFFGHL